MRKTRDIGRKSKKLGLNEHGSIEKKTECYLFLVACHSVGLSVGWLVGRSRNAYGPNREAEALQRERERGKKQKSIEV